MQFRQCQRRLGKEDKAFYKSIENKAFYKSIRSQPIDIGHLVSDNGYLYVMHNLAYAPLSSESETMLRTNQFCSHKFQNIFIIIFSRKSRHCIVTLKSAF